MKFELEIHGFCNGLAVLFYFIFEGGIEHEDFFDAVLAQPVEGVVDRRIVANLSKGLTMK